MGRACGVLQLKSRQSAGKAGKYCDVSDGTYSDSDGVSEGNVTKLAPSEKVKIGTRTAHSATEQRLCAVFLKKGMTRKRIEKSAKKSYSKRINYATL